MKFLLDTHTFLWLIQGDVKLSQKAREMIETPENELYFSIASFWEITIKLGLGKLEIAHSLKEMELLLQQLEIGLLPIAVSDLECYLTLPLHHRDPFDRLLIAQAMHHSLVLIGQDVQFDSYSIQRLWT